MGNDDFLPVGSVVRLKNAKRNVVVIGYSIVEENSIKVWDYMGCPYPVGVVASDQNLLFNRGDIERVIFLGYSDPEDKNFRNQLKETMKRIKNNGIN